MTGIISLSEARAALRLPSTQDVDNADLQSLIDAATAPMEDLCGPILSRPCDDWLDGGWHTVHVLWAPVIAVTSVVECYGAGYARTLSAQPLDAGAFDAFGYTVDLVDGAVTRRVAGQASPFVAGRRNVHVVYTAGRATPVAPNLVRATRRLVRWLWQTEMQGQRPAGSTPENVSQTPNGYDVPTAVVRLCGADLRVPGIG
jgi:hypothetical protein